MFYAVRIGKEPGIYKHWHGKNGAHKQVKGVRGYDFKSFKSYREAEEYLYGIKPNSGVNVYIAVETIKNSERGAYVIAIDNRLLHEAEGFKRTTIDRLILMATTKALIELKDEDKIKIYLPERFFKLNPGKNRYLWRKFKLAKRNVKARFIPSKYVKSVENFFQIRYCKDILKTELLRTKR